MCGDVVGLILPVTHWRSFMEIHSTHLQTAKAESYFTRIVGYEYILHPNPQDGSVANE